MTVRVMDNFLKYLCGAAMSLLGLLAPVRDLIVCAVVFIAIDFVTGVAADRKAARLAGRPWGFESDKAWNTVVKLGFVMGGIVLAWLIDRFMLDFMTLNLAKLFTGFVCGVEFWSYLENAAVVSNHPVFRYLKKFMKDKFDKELSK